MGVGACQVKSSPVDELRRDLLLKGWRDVVGLMGLGDV